MLHGVIGPIPIAEQVIRDAVQRLFSARDELREIFFPVRAHVMGSSSGQWAVHPV
ncbi:hypothetical protein [Dactylosporangium sp. NPDC051541]|uniref:hypothetical protein n=1 Tax=Dactylosporangium sp. NPDC051541 TaxID=3363977 RepID=UPI0037BC554D